MKLLLLALVLANVVSTGVAVGFSNWLQDWMSGLSNPAEDVEDESSDECVELTVYSQDYMGGWIQGKWYHGESVEDETTVFDQPFYASFEDASAAALDYESSNPIGRKVGWFNRKIFSGVWNFQIYEKDGSWITATFGFDYNTPEIDQEKDRPNVVTGGSGYYRGVTGTFKDELPVRDPPRSTIHKHMLCLYFP